MSLLLGLIASIAYTARKYFYKLKNVFKMKDAADLKNGWAGILKHGRILSKDMS